MNKWCGNGGTRDNTRHMSESSRSGFSPLARGGCPLESRASYREPSCSALQYNPFFLNKGRKQGQARMVQPSAELFDRMQCSAGKPRQSVSQGPLSTQYSTAPGFQISIYMQLFLFYVNQANAMFMVWCFIWSFGRLELCLWKLMVNSLKWSNCNVYSRKSACSLCNWSEERTISSRPVLGVKVVIGRKFLFSVCNFYD